MDRKQRQALETAEKVVDVQIVRTGEKLIVPESVSLSDAIDALERRITYEEEWVGVYAPIDCLFQDGANALYEVLNEKFGFAGSTSTPGWFGSTPPTLIAVETGYNKTKQVPWGRIVLPGVEGHIDTGIEEVQGGYTRFVIQGEIKRKHEHQVNDIIERTKVYLQKNSLYRGQAVRIRFRDDRGKVLERPEPKFIDLSRVNENDLIYATDVHEQIETNLFTPLRYADACRQNGVPLKRGVLLAGPFGTGKTLAATVAAKLATQNGWTYFYCERADELKQVIRFAQQYGPSVVFCEDIDRVMSGDRDVSIDDILNVIDGIESKSKEVMTVLTTNELEDINPAMLRPGRLDAIIYVRPPDAPAAIKLVRLYGGKLIDKDEDLLLVGEALDGMIPAMIREVVEKSKLAAIKLAGSGSGFKITAQALLEAAESMKLQNDLLKEKTPDLRSEREKAAAIVAAAIERNKDAKNGHAETLVEAGV